MAGEMENAGKYTVEGSARMSRGVTPSVCLESAFLGWEGGRDGQGGV